MVLLNQAIAAAMVHGPVTGLERLERLASEGRLAGHHRLHAVHAHLLELAGHRERAIQDYRAAAEHSASAPERDYLLLRAARLAATLRGQGHAREE